MSDNPRQSRLSHYFVLCVYVLWFILFCECVLEVYGIRHQDIKISLTPKFKLIFVSMPTNPYKDFKHLGRAQRYRRLNGINELNGPEIIKSTTTPAHLVENIEHENSLDDYNINPYESDIETTSSESENGLESEIEMEGSSKMYEENALQCKLAHWVSINCVPLNVVTKLLKILNECNPSDVIKLPKDARTLMKTPKIPLVIGVVGDFGKYIHFGLEEDLYKV